MRVALLSVVTGIALGSAVTAGLSARPDSDGNTPGTVAVQRRTFDDATELPLVITADAGYKAVAPREGVVTASTCLVGQELMIGSSPFSLDGAPVIALPTDVPVWRDLVVGLRGADVDGIHRALTRERKVAAAPNGSPLTRSDVESVAGSSVDRLELSKILWVPAGNRTISACKVELGRRLSHQDITLEFPPQVSRVQVNLSDRGRGRTLTVGDRSFELSADGVVAGSERVAFSRLPVVRAWLVGDRGEPLTGTVSLSSPVHAWTVPPGAVITRHGQHCVVDPQGVVTLVTIVSSELGVTLVAPAKNTPMPDVVSLNPSSETCA